MHLEQDKEKKMDILNLGEFIELLSRDEEITQNEKKREQENGKEMEFGKAVDELINEVLASINKDFVECEKARNKVFAKNRENYHSSIESLIKRPLSIEEEKLVDEAFPLAFINGWVAHKENGGSYDK